MLHYLILDTLFKMDIKVMHLVYLFLGALMHLDHVNGHESAFISVEIIKKIMKLDKEITGYLRLYQPHITEDQIRIEK